MSVIRCVDDLTGKIYFQSRTVKGQVLVVGILFKVSGTVLDVPGRSSMGTVETRKRGGSKNWSAWLEGHEESMGRELENNPGDGCYEKRSYRVCE